MIFYFYYGCLYVIIFIIIIIILTFMFKLLVGSFHLNIYLRWQALKFINRERILRAIQDRYVPKIFDQRRKLGRIKEG